MYVVSGRPCWSDAESAAQWIESRECYRRTLLLLARLPFLDVRTLERLTGLHGGASIYRYLARLRQDGLIAAVRPSLRPGHSPRLYYLADLGLATVALCLRVDVHQLARANRLRGVDLLGLLPALPQLMASYKLLAALAVSRPGRPDLLEWERPWRRRYQRPTAKAATTVALPAYARLSWDGETGSYLLIPDLATVPFRAYRATIDRLFALRGFEGEGLPTLVVATTDRGRAAGWERLLEDTRRVRAEAPLLARIAAWDDLSSGFPDVVQHSREDREVQVRLTRLPRLASRCPTSRLPRPVGDALVETWKPQSVYSPGRIALGLSATERRLLELVARHPFLTLEGLANVFDWQMEWARERRDGLIARGLMRLVEVGEVGAELATLESVELTLEGLRLVAAQQGVSLAMAVRYNGLVGGGPSQPIGSRRKLVATLHHTLGVDGIFVGLISTAREVAKAGGDDALVEWRNSAACSRRYLRPDGYGIYRHRGKLYGFFLEYDRGTMNARDYHDKFAAYFEYLASGRFQRDYDGFPTILMVTTDYGAEERIASAARSAAVGRGVDLPLLLTCEWRLDRDPGSRHGLLGCIWREPSSARRRHWLQASPDARTSHRYPQYPPAG